MSYATPVSRLSLLLITITTILSIVTPAFAAPYCKLRATASAPQATGVSGSTGNSTSGGNVAVAWYPGWQATTYPPSNISWSKYTHVTFAFAITTNDASTVDLLDQNQTLTDFVTAAHQNNAKALLSIGGWTGSQYFSTSVGSDTNRTKFASAVTGLAQQYNLDGIDFDWEYPGGQGIGCNIQTAQDTQNFATFLQLLRQDPVGKNLILTAAVPVTKASFAGSMTDLSPFANTLDWLAIMNYDVNGGGTNHPTGANAPMNNCVPTNASATQAILDWTAAGIPHNKLVLGVPSYGRAFNVSSSIALTSTGGFASGFPNYDFEMPMPMGANDGPTPTPDVCGVYEGNAGTSSFHDLVGTFLATDGTAAPGMIYQFDDCSQTPFIYDPKQGLLLSYDDAKSFGVKGSFITSNGLRGFSMWDTSGDYNDILVDAIRAAMN